MAVIKPFRAVRPQNDLADKVAALPYDVYNRNEAAEVVKGDDYSFLRIDRPETQLPEIGDMYAPEVYRKADRMLQELEEKGICFQEEKACYYVYELIMDGRSQTGLVACSSVDDYLNNVILKHEKTRKEKEEDRIRHIDACSAQTGPIFLAYRSNAELHALLEDIKKGQPEVSFTADDGITHSVWKIDADETIEKITELFAAIPNTYIADGHHRTASAVEVSRMRREADPAYTGDEEYNYFLSVLFAAEELKIMDYNRVIKDLNGMSPREVKEKLAKIFTVEKAETSPYHPECKGEIGMYLEDTWYKLTVKPEFCSDDPVEGLDVALLQREVLAPMWRIENPKTDNRIDFVGGIRGLEELERRCDYDCAIAFAMYPTSIEELFEVADAQLLMPPKSTWFEPKLRSGLFIHKIER